MEAERPVRVHGGQTDDASTVGAGDLCLGRTGEEVELDSPADGPPCDIFLLEDDLMAVGVAVEHSVSIGDVLNIGISAVGNVLETAVLRLGEVSGVEIKWVNAVHIAVNGIGRVCGI